MPPCPNCAIARAHSNIALVKYWGKRDELLNLPAVGSISLTLAALYTQTSVRFASNLPHDSLAINGGEAGQAPPRISAFLDKVRDMAAISSAASIVTRNNFPTAAGLASSASGFAALALAASRAAGLNLAPAALSILARQGSGSAARSVFGGFVEMQRGERADGEDAFAKPLCAEEVWPLKMAIGIVDRRPKQTGSTQGMRSSADTAPFYPAWVTGSDADLAQARRAIAERDFEALGTITEHSCLKMHALMLASRPGLLYWQPPTLAAIHAVRELRARGTQAYFTIDAGPQIKLLYQAPDEAAVLHCLQQVEGIEQVLTSALGPAAHIINPASD